MRKLARAGINTGHRWLHAFRSMLSGKPLHAVPVGPPVFIVGAGHSGTTLLLAVLGASSRIHSLPYETGFLERPVWQIDGLVRRFNRDANQAGKVRWAEKTPRHVRCLTLLFRLFPEARVILMLRDGRDVACSLRARTGHFASSVLRWLESNAAGEPFWTDPRVRVLKYESLVANPTVELTALMSFLGEPFEAPMLHPEDGAFRYYGGMERAQVLKPEVDRLTGKPESVQGGANDLYRSWQVRQPIFDGRGRWRRDMTAEERETFRRLAGAALVRYGYETDMRW